MSAARVNCTENTANTRKAVTTFEIGRAAFNMALGRHNPYPDDIDKVRRTRSIIAFFSINQPYAIPAYVIPITDRLYTNRYYCFRNGKTVYTPCIVGLRHSAAVNR